MYDLIDMSDDDNLYIINILIKLGAKPVKDNIGRTPLMCLPFHSFTGMTKLILNMYCEFEAKFYKISPKDYYEKLLKLRTCEFQNTISQIKSHVLIPIKETFDEFWGSFHQNNFKPKHVMRC
jgi:hypothetical protein